MLHFIVSNDPVQSAMLPDDQLLEALHNFNAAFSFIFFLLLLACIWYKEVFQTAAKKKWEVRKLEPRTSQL